MKLSFAVLAFMPIVFCQNFNKAYVGVAFGPYTKYKESNGQYPWYNSYSTDEIKKMLEIISKKFLHIATYGMGVKPYNVDGPWYKADSSALIARAAGNLNKEKNRKVIDVAIGIFQDERTNIQNAEVNNAFAAAIDANKRHKGTVWGLVFTNEYINDVRSGKKVLGMISHDRNRAHQLGLQVGTRIQNCYDILNRGSPLYSTLEKIALKSDFIMCNIYPQKVHQGISMAVTDVTSQFINYRAVFKAINPILEVMIGETGWPSQGQSFNNAPTSVHNLKEFWQLTGDWASRNSVRTYMFEAMDEPWKGAKKTGEAHYGWWKRQNNNGQVYIEKATNQQMRSGTEI